MLRKTHRFRLLMLAGMTMLVFGAILARLYNVQIQQHAAFKARAEQQQNTTVKLIPHRGDILDRNGLKLATSFLSDTIYLDTRKYRPNPDEAQADDDSVEDTATTSDSALMRVVKERFAKQKAKELVKDKAIAAAALARKNKNKQKAWDAAGVDPQLLDDLADALATAEPAAPEQTDTTTATATVQPARMSHDHARELVQAMFEKPKRQVFYSKAPETLTAKMEEIEARYALPEGFIVYEKHSKRFYPNGSLASHMLGFTSVDGSGDNVGISGIESEYNKELKGAYAEQKIQISSMQRGLAPLSEKVIESTYGENVQLTIDQTLQMFTEQALRAEIGRYQAKGGIALVMDVHTGEILALANCPDFNPNTFNRATPAQLRNRILTDPIEIGSVMKIITATLTIDRGLVTPEEIINCSSPHTFGTRVVKDVHDVGTVPFRTAFAESSNVGLVTVGLRLQPADYYRGLLKFGLGQPSRIDLPGEGNGTFHDLSQWSVLTRSSLPMGYEAALTPMQVICALGSIGNGGVRLRPHLLKQVTTLHGDVIQTGETHPVERVATAETCKTIRELMEGVVLEGTGKAAIIPGYRVGGKTGTTVKYNSQKEDEDHRKYYASFAGLLPIDNPRFAIYCYIDEPVGAKFGGTVAAPVFREIALAAAHVYGVAPDDPVAFAQAKFEGLTTLSDLISTTSSGAMDEQQTLQIAQAAEKIATEKAHARQAAAQPALPGMGGSHTPRVAIAQEATSVTWERIFASDTNAKPAPDLRGLTMTQAFEKLSAAGLEGRMSGSGRAFAQQPAPGAPIHNGDAVTVKFILNAGPDNAPVIDLSTAAAVGALPPGPQMAQAPEGVEHVTLQAPAGLRRRSTRSESAGKAALPPAE